jgi:hypothetical protein
MAMGVAISPQLLSFEKTRKGVRVLKAFSMLGTPKFQRSEGFA